MYQSVQMPRRLLNLFPHIIVTVEVEDVGYKIECILIVLNFGVQTREVEAIGEVFFVNLAEVFVASRGYELVVGQHVSESALAVSTCASFSCQSDHHRDCMAMSGPHSAPKMGAYPESIS